MKEKVIFTLSLASFIGIIWLSSTNQSTNLSPVVSEERTPLPVDNYPQDYIDDVSPGTTYVNDSILESDFSVIEACSLKPVDTDVFTFGDAFQYYRQCLGSDSSFQWKGRSYTTILSEEVIIQVADSVQAIETQNTNQVSEIH